MPVPKIKELNQALKGHAKSYGIELQDNLKPLNHFTKSKSLVKSHLESLLKDRKGFKFIETLEITFEKDTIDSKTGKRVSIYKKAFFNGKAKTITKANDMEPELSMSRQEILNVIDKWVSEGSGWVIDRIDSHYINVTLYKPLNGSSYIELPTELRNPKKGFSNHGAQAIDMLKQGENILKFNNFHKQLPVPFVIYADFEAITKKGTRL